MPSIRHKVDVSFEDGRIAVRPGGGVLFSFPIAGNPRLENATPEQLVHVEVDETGMHWPDIDEDLSLAGLLRGDWGQFVNASQGALCVREGRGAEYGTEDKVGRKPVVYLESSFVSYLTGRWSTNDGVRANQTASRAWWALMKDRVAPVVSYVVWNEISDGDEGLASERAEIIRGLPSWKASPESEELAARLIKAHAIPETEDDDARHVAVAAVGGADVLLTWNCRHINNAMTLSKTVKIIGQAGFVCPVITDPAQLLRQMEYTP